MSIEHLLVNKSKIPLPRKFILQSLDFTYLQLKRQKILNSPKNLTVVFLDTKAAKAMNLEFRGKDYATDILSFEGDEESLGELIICPQVLKKQAQENGHSFKAELAYMLIHGVLHLLGHDHEKSKRKAAEMFRIQDQVFDSLCDKFRL